MKRLIIIIVTMSFVFTNACSQRKWENGSILVGIGEFTAFVFLPIVFEGLYSLVNGDRKKHFYIGSSIHSEYR